VREWRNGSECSVDAVALLTAAYEDDAEALHVVLDVLTHGQTACLAETLAYWLIDEMHRHDRARGLTGVARRRLLLYGNHFSRKAEEQ
jgi:hypothetical protein